MAISDEIQLDRQRWTHMALHVKDLDASIEWYETYTHLRLFERNEDVNGWGAWMIDPEQPDPPFLLVMAQFREGKDPFAPSEHGIMGPFAHFGIEMTSQEEVDAIAEKAKQGGHLALGPMMMPAPVGYICFLKDPDGNRVEFSYNQGVYETVREKWIEGGTVQTMS
ncbi:MAG: VOC family protein [Pseudomonadota bacterium]